MSNPPNQPPSQNSPNGASGEPNGFNWRMFVLFGIASLVLAVAFLNPMAGEVGSQMNYSQFRKHWDQGLVILDDAKKPLNVFTSDASYDATIEGWMHRMPVLPKGEQAKTEVRAFRIPVNLDLQSEVIRELLGDDLRTKPLAADAPMGDPAEGELLSLAELRKAIAKGEIKLRDTENPL